MSDPLTGERAAADHDPTAARPTAPSAPPWHVLADGEPLPPARPLSTRRVVVQVAAAAAAVIVVVAVVGAFAARRLAERESVNDAAQRANLLAQSVVQPVLDDGVVTGDAQALKALDEAVRQQVLGPGAAVRVKLWTPDGRIVYSDEPRLVGDRFELDEEEREVLADPQTRAEVSDLDRPENRFERGQGKLLEVYRPVRTASGQTLLFETYFAYDEVTERRGQLWRGFAGLVISSMLLLVVLLIPVLWRLVQRVRSEQEHREALLRRTVDASQDERRRIAGTLHDGVVQELAATSFALTGLESEAERDGDATTAARLHEAVGTVRGAIGGLRSLLVDIYPPSLETAGLAAALHDLTGPLRARDVAVSVDVPDDDAHDLTPDDRRLAFRVAHEAVTNAAKHSAASHLSIRLDGRVLEVADDGVGFDVPATQARPESGHLGLQVMTDVAQDAGARLRVASAPGRGTRWQLTVPRT